MKFDIIKKDNLSKARAGEITTGHGIIKTPIFMPVGTAGTVKGVHHHELTEDIKAQIILSNTYHIYLRPGMDTIARANGLHNFINWQKPLLTDSGGYQIFSLAENRKLTKEGAKFQSHIDGSYHFFTPENIIDIQRIIGADIIMSFDECTPYPCSPEDAKKSMKLTHHWLERAYNHFHDTSPVYGHEQAFFPIVQGSTYNDLRKISAETIAGYDCEGNAIGGLSVGEPAEKMYEIIETVNQILPEDKPRYLMGVGTPVNILESISLGIDMFDCVMPTRNGRNGMLFTNKGIINIRNEKWKNDFSNLDDEGSTFVDFSYSKAYLRHLIISKEILGAQIASIHNLGFYLKLVEEARNNIIEGNFVSWKNNIINNLTARL
jgi:queuine tRNA-ribosyltransferase